MGPVVDFPASEGPGDRPKPEPASELTRQGRMLVDALTRKSRKSQRAVGMYMEARRAMVRNDSPESLHVAAYEVREFMNELPRALDVPVVSYGQLVEKVQGLIAAWKARSSKSKCLKDGKWDGQIDRNLRRLLGSITKFAKWVEEQVPSRSAEAALVVQKLAPTEHPFPGVLLKIRTDEWAELLQFFNGLTHHNSDPDPLEFTQRLETLERFLLDHLEPQTFADQSEIDRLIREVEG